MSKACNRPLATNHKVKRIFIMGRITKQQIAIATMVAMKDEHMDKVLPAIAAAAGITEYQARGYYWHLTRTNAAPGVFVKLPKGKRPNPNKVPVDPAAKAEAKAAKVAERNAKRAQKALDAELARNLKATARAQKLIARQAEQAKVTVAKPAKVVTVAKTLPNSDKTPAEVAAIRAANAGRLAAVLAKKKGSQTSATPKVYAPGQVNVPKPVAEPELTDEDCRQRLKDYEAELDAQGKTLFQPGQERIAS